MIISFDQSLSNTGVAIIEMDQYGSIVDIKLRTIKTNPKELLAARLMYIRHEVTEIVNTYKENLTVVYEGIFSHLNVKTLMSLSKVQGCIETVFAEHNIPMLVVSPKEWQSYLKLDKIKDKQRSVNYIINTPDLYSKISDVSKLNEHTADALCLALFKLSLKLNIYT